MLQTEERIAEVAVCCPGYKMRDVSCVPICPNGKTGPGCSEGNPQIGKKSECRNKTRLKKNNCKLSEHGLNKHYFVDPNISKRS